MESATRRTTKSRKFLSGLAKCVENNLPISFILRWFKDRHLLELFDTRLCFR